MSIKIKFEPGKIKILAKKYELRRIRISVKTNRIRVRAKNSLNPQPKMKETVSRDFGHLVFLNSLFWSHYWFPQTFLIFGKFSRT